MRVVLEELTSGCRFILRGKCHIERSARTQYCLNRPKALVDTMYTFQFPKKREDIEKTYAFLVNKGIRRMAPHLARWRFTQLYIEGIRNFLELNYNTGVVKSSWGAKDGKLRFIYEDIISKRQSQIGRLLGMDISPRVTRDKHSLDGQRKAAVGQAVLSDLFTLQKTEKLKKSLIPSLLDYGMLGMRLWRNPEDKKDIGIEKVMPWAIIPLPIGVDSPSQVKGMIIRERVPLEGLRDRYEKNLSEVTRHQVPRGDMPEENKHGLNVLSQDEFFMQSPRSSVKGSSDHSGSDRGKTELMDVVTQGMVYLWDENRYLTEQYVFAEDKLIDMEVDFKGAKVYSPVTTIHDITIGFYGRAWTSLLIPMNREVESSIARQFQNLRDMDLYGLVLTPTMAGLTRLSQTGVPGMKQLRYEMDPMADGSGKFGGPLQFLPVNSGLAPSRLIAMGAGINDRIANQPAELLAGSAPGRVDSAAGIGALNETSGVPLIPTAHDIADGMSHMYMASLDMTRSSFDDQDVINITALDDSMAGIVFDPKTGQMEIAQNAIPHPDDVTVTVQARMPVSKQEQRLELKDHLATQVISPREYRIKARLLNLDLPVENKAEWENYRKAQYESLLLWGNGEDVPDIQEGQSGVIFSEDADMHDVHIWVHDFYIAKPEFNLIAPAVRDRFLAHRNLHLQGGGGRLDDFDPVDEADAFLLDEQQNPQLQEQPAA